jgi:hypothetical protein
VVRDLLEEQAISHRLGAMRRGLAFAAAFAAAFVFSASAALACISPRTVPIGSGLSPSGSKWEVSASIKKNGSCREWLFAVDFVLPEVTKWGSATGIPVGGHVSRFFNISASDDVSLDGTERVFSGYTGREVATIKARMSDGRQIEIRPMFPPQELRARFVWLRSFRYFVQYYPPESEVASVLLFNKAGTLLYKADAVEGFF